MKSPGRLFLLLCVAALAVGMVGCQSVGDKIAEEAGERIVEGATGVDVEADGEDVTITGEDGSSFTSSASGELPEDWPEDVPVYDGNITSSMVTEGKFTLAVEAEDPPVDVFEWSLEQIKDEGWTVTTEFKAENGGTIAAEKDDRIVQYTVTDVDEGSSFIVFVGPK